MEKTRTQGNETVMKVWREIAEAASESAVYREALAALGKVAGRQAEEGRSMTILGVPYFRQETEDTCAPACLRMVLAFRFPDKPVAEAELAKRCRCLEGLGTMPDDVFRAARRSKLPAQWLDNARMEAEVVAALSAGCPVVVNVELRALPYMPPPPSDDPEREVWHSVLIVGVDDHSVYLHDPHRTYGGPRGAIERKPLFTAWPHYGHSAYRL